MARQLRGAVRAWDRYGEPRTPTRTPQQRERQTSSASSKASTKVLPLGVEQGSECAVVGTPGAHDSQFWCAPSAHSEHSTTSLVAVKANQKALGLTDSGFRAQAERWRTSTSCRTSTRCHCRDRRARALVRSKRRQWRESNMHVGTSSPACGARMWPRLMRAVSSCLEACVASPRSTRTY